jgi:hypothetical protein
LNIKDPGIDKFVDGEIHNKKLWPEPLSKTVKITCPIKDRFDSWVQGL